jgi:hypothetical protein
MKILSTTNWQLSTTNRNNLSSPSASQSPRTWTSSTGKCPTIFSIVIKTSSHLLEKHQQLMAAQTMAAFGKSPVNFKLKRQILPRSIGCRMVLTETYTELIGRQTSLPTSHSSQVVVYLGKRQWEASLTSAALKSLHSKSNRSSRWKSSPQPKKTQSC